MDFCNSARITLSFVTTAQGGITFDVTCPAGATDHTFDTYTATGDTVTLYSSQLQLAVTLTKQ